VEIEASEELMPGPKKILTIDGGGVRGVFSAAILEQIESATGKPASRIFDCFYGTSTGAILAAGLACGIKASELKKLYLDHGAEIFEKLPLFNPVRYAYWTYSKAPLEKKLKEIFGETGDIFSAAKLLSVQAKDTETGATVFFSNFPYVKARYPARNMPLWEIIRASTAAPTYFQSESDRYVDGGVSCYNNPSYAAFIGATKYLDWPSGAEALRIYSIGTGYHPPLIPAGELDDKIKPLIAAYAVEDLMNDVNLLQNQVMHRLSNEKACWYKRYTIKFAKESFDEFQIPSEGIDFDALAEMDAVPYAAKLALIGEAVGKKLINASDF
jgi:hypothetical protein